jgi:Sigma-70 region 2
MGPMSACISSLPWNSSWSANDSATTFIQIVAARSELISMNHKSESCLENSGETAHISQISAEAFPALFSQYRRVLYSVAYRVLFNHRDAEDAVQKFFLSASTKIPTFECEGSFRSWLLRGLIDEALAILCKNRIRSAACSEPVLDSSGFLPPSDQAHKEASPSVR